MPSIHIQRANTGLSEAGAMLGCGAVAAPVRIQIVLPTITIVPPCIPVDMMLCMVGCWGLGSCGFLCHPSASRVTPELSGRGLPCLCWVFGLLALCWALSYIFGFSIIRGLGFGLPVRVHNVRYFPRWGYVWTREPSSRGGYQAGSSQHLYMN